MWEQIRKKLWKQKHAVEAFSNVIREGCKKKSKCKLFPKAYIFPKLTFLKSLYTVKRGSKIDFFNPRMCFVKFWEQQMKFWDTQIFFWNFCQKVYILRGGGSQRQFGKSLHFDFFLPPSLMALKKANYPVFPGITGNVRNGFN